MREIGRDTTGANQASLEEARVRTRVKKLNFTERSIANLVANTMSVSHEDLFSASRGRAGIAHARQILMYLLNVVVGLNMVEVGKLLGRDRSTVSHACALIEDRREDTDFDEMLNALETQIERAIDGQNGEVSIQGSAHAKA